jgi:hypothetical protein
MFSGVGVIAGGPYGCARTTGSVYTNANRAQGPCMAGSYTWTQWLWACWFAGCPGPDRPDENAAIELAGLNARKNAIDPLASLKRQRVFLLSGKKDDKVVSAVVDTLHRFYDAFVPPANIKEEDLPRPAHTFPTDSFKGNDCSASKPPYVSDCGYDAAGQLLSHLYGSVKPRNVGAPNGSLLPFDQTKFFPANLETGMAGTAYVYVPKTCAAKGASWLPPDARGD